MKTFIRTRVNVLFVENWKILLLNFCVLCFLCGTELSGTVGYEFGIWGYLLLMLTNHYYIMYCVLPVIFFVLTKHIRRLESIELIRYQNRFQQVRKSTLCFFCWLLLYFLLTMLIVFIIGCRNFELSIKIKPLAFSGYNELAEIFNLYVSYFENSAVAAVAAALYLVAGLTMLGSVLGFIYHRFGYRKVIAASMILYLSGVLGFRLQFGRIVPIFGFNNYIILHHGLILNGTTNFAIILVCMAVMTCFCLGVRLKGRADKIDDFVITRRAKIITLGMIVVIMLLEIIKGYTGTAINLRETMVSLLFGVGESTTNFFSWLKITIIYLLPLFIVGISEYKMKDYCQGPMLIRCKNLKNLQNYITKRQTEYLIIYTLLLWVIGGVTYYFGSHVDLFGSYINVAYGGYSFKQWNIYMLFFFTNLLFDFCIFKYGSDLCSEIAAVLVLLLYRYIFFLFPKLNVVDLNFGVVNLFENQEHGFLAGWSFWIQIGVILVYFAVIRRFRYGSYKIR